MPREGPPWHRPGLVTCRQVTVCSEGHRIQGRHGDQPELQLAKPAVKGKLFELYDSQGHTEAVRRLSSFSP